MSIENQNATQVNYPGQAAKRTAASMIAAVPIAIGIMIAISEIIKVINDVFGAIIPESFTSNFLFISTFLIGCSVALTRVMAIPAVNSVLEKFGLSAVPAHKESEQLLTDAGVDKDADVFVEAPIVSEEQEYISALAESVKEFEESGEVSNASFEPLFDEDESLPGYTASEDEKNENNGYYVEPTAIG